MASPSQPQATTSPPTEPSFSNNTINNTPSQPTTTNQPSTSTPAPAPASAPTAAPTTATPATASQPTQIPSTSLHDSGKSRRPRDVRLIHMLLASLGVTAYQERVPLQLLDFAYRYTSTVLQDAVHLATEGYTGAIEPGNATGRGGGGGAGAHDVSSVSLAALRLSIASRLHYQFQTGLPKEFLMDVASERNRVALPGAARGFDSGGNVNRAGPSAAHQSLVMGGMRLPPERFCLTGTGWNMKEEWESEGEEEVDETGPGGAGAGEEGVAAAEEGDEGEGGGQDDDGDGKMEDIFGEDTAIGEDDGDGDKAMEDV